ncbi:MAG: DUF4124 domain-containing protein [Steroidobacteraceae bacterium]
MRQLASFLLFGFALTAGAAEIWRWKDASGQWHFSDNPLPGGEKVIITPQGRSGGTPPAPTYSSAPIVLPQEIMNYARCVVTQPANDAVFQLSQTVPASISVEPPLQPGHVVEVLLNGAVYPNWTPDLPGYTFTDLYRGSYTLAVRVKDARGRVLCSGPATNFHVRQATLLSPARQPAKPH